MKADGLAAGKGVVVAQTVAEAEAAIDMMFGGGLGDAGAEVVVEEFLDGEEASFFALCDGETAIPLVSAQDHKRVFDGDQGPNTGGMGAYSPVPIMTPAMERRAMDEFVLPTVAAMKEMGMPFTGVLYLGLMITASGPKLIEYNVRFGDPECQVLMLRLMSDIVPALLASAEGQLGNFDLRWFPDTALTVVMATKGYPGSYGKGSVIEGLDDGGRGGRRRDLPRRHRRARRAHRRHWRAGAQCLRARQERSGGAAARLCRGRPYPLAGGILPPRHRLARGRAGAGAHANVCTMTKSLAVALGGGGARGIAHIAVLEVLDEMGVRPTAIAGTSAGAMIGAAYAAGMSGRDIRRHVIALAHNRSEVLRRLVAARAGSFASLFSGGFGSATQVDGEKFCEHFLPATMPDDFSALKIPLLIIASDLYRRQQVVLSSGSLRRAVAASMALPTVVRPIVIDDRVLVDGGATNPLPFDQLRDRADVVIAVDISGEPNDTRRDIPTPWEAILATILVMGQAITNEKLKHGAPDLIIRPNVGLFRTLDFFQASAILRVCEAGKAEIRQRLTALLEAS